METRHELYDGQGNIVEIDDTRTVSGQAAIKIAAIKAACSKAIEDTGIGWMVEREVTGGTAVPAEVKSQCAEYRAHSNALEAVVIGLVTGAYSNDDKQTCDAINAITW